MSMAIPLIPYVGRPASEVYLPSDAPVSMTGTTGTPGHISATTLVKGCMTSGFKSVGGTALDVGAVSLTSPLSFTYRTVTLGSWMILINCCRISSRELLGRIRQFTLADAVCGKALLACPPLRRVGTQVVRMVALYFGISDRCFMACSEGGVFRIPFISAAV